MKYVTPIFPCEVPVEGVELYIKRDDFLPFSFGGNKARIAQEFYLDMCAKGMNCMVGYGNPRSNLSRILANMMQMYHTECHMILPDDGDGTRPETNNSRIVGACQAYCHPCRKDNVAETVEGVLNYCREKRGLKPYYIYGDKYGKGNEAVPVRAYAKVYEEIQEQEKELNAEFDYIFVPVGTGMTYAGLLAGKHLKRGKEKIVGISVARKNSDEIPVIDNYLREYFKDHGQKMEHFDGIEVTDDYLDGGYGKCGEGVRDTIRYMMLEKGIALDPTYTGKGFYGMIEYIKSRGIGGRILFLHTGGIPLFFDHMDILAGV